MSAHTLAELYETLTTGAKFSMQFNCKEEAVGFRNRLGTCKFRIEKDLKLMGVIEHQTLTMEYDDDTNIATLYLREPSDKKSQTFEILSIVHPTNNPEPSE